MPTDVIIQIRNAEREAERRVTAAREQARCLLEEIEQEVQRLLERAEANARSEAEARKRHLISLAQEEADALRRQGEQEANLLRDRLARRTDEAAVSVVAYVLPRTSNRPADQSTNRTMPDDDITHRGDPGAGDGFCPESRL